MNPSVLLGLVASVLHYQRQKGASGLEQAKEIAAQNSFQSLQLVVNSSITFVVVVREVVQSIQLPRIDNNGRFGGIYREVLHPSVLRLDVPLHYNVEIL